MNDKIFNADKCGCGRDVRYTSSDGKGSCNKYYRCLTWDEQDKLIRRTQIDSDTYKTALEEIKDMVDGECYEYRAIAKNALKIKVAS